MLAAVDKFRYDSLEEAMQKTASIFIAAAEKLAKKKSFDM